jgi:hypothetical protein
MGAKVQHYVPQFLLRNFGTGKKHQVWVFDKVSERAFLTHPKNIASESRFYDFEANGTLLTLEPYLSKVESAAKPILEGIGRLDSLAGLDASMKGTLAEFLSVQLTRTRAFREQWSALPGMIREAFASRGEVVADGSQAADIIRDLSANEVKSETGHFMLEARQLFAHHFLAKGWVLLSTTKKQPFILGDHPLALQNMVERPGRGNLGLAVPGIEIYFPLSPVRALALWCRSLTGLALRLRGDRSGERLAASIASALSTGRPISCSNENVENMNSLQLAGSERYLFSCKNDFESIKEILRTHPASKAGPRLQVAE